MKYIPQLLLAISCLFSAATMAVPVGAITDASGQRIGMQDIPDRGEYPGKIHRRYCAETATFSAIKASVLAPNTITSDRRMPAGEVLEVRCQNLRTSWKVFPVFAEDTQLKQVNAKLVDLETEIKALRVAVANIPPSVTQTPLQVSLEDIPWWENPAFWNLVLLPLVILLLIAVLAAQPVYQEFVLGKMGKRSDVRKGSISRNHADNLYRPADLSHTVWIDHPENQSDVLEVYVALETPARGPRLFRYCVSRTAGTDGFRLIQPQEARSAQAVAESVAGAVERYFGIVAPNNERERYLVEEAFRDGRLKEIMLSKIRAGI